MTPCDTSCKNYYDYILYIDNKSSYYIYGKYNSCTD